MKKNTRSKDFYIYNLEQANFFLQKGLVPIEVGLGTMKTMFVRFRRDDEAERVFTQWCNKS